MIITFLFSFEAWKWRGKFVSVCASKCFVREADTRSTFGRGKLAEIPGKNCTGAASFVVSNRRDFTI